MGIIDNIESLRALEEQYNTDRSVVAEAIMETIHSIGQNPAIRPLGKNCFTIRFSDLVDTPWSPSFHDWHRQAELLIDLLLKKPVLRWAKLIRLWTDKPGYTNSRIITVEKISLDRRFLSEVAARL